MAIQSTRKNDTNNVFLKIQKGCLLLLFFIFNVASKHTRRHRRFFISHFRRLFRRSLFIYRFSTAVFANNKNKMQRRLCRINTYSDALELEYVRCKLLYVVRTFRSDNPIV